MRSRALKILAFIGVSILSDPASQSHHFTRNVFEHPTGSLHLHRALSKRWRFQHFRVGRAAYYLYYLTCSTIEWICFWLFATSSAWRRCPDMALFSTFFFFLSVPFSLVLYLLLVIPDYDHLSSRSVFVNNFTYSILLSLHQTGVLIAKIYGIPHKWTFYNS